MSPDNPLPISIEQELVPNTQIPLTTHEFRAWKEKQGFEVGHKGTAYNPEKKAYLYTKSAWVVSDLDQAEKSLKVLGILKDNKIIHPGTEFGLSTTDDGRVQVFGVIRELEEYSAEKNGIESRQALKTGINELNMYDPDSHVVSWIRRAVPDYDPNTPNYNPILTILSDAEARHTHNWAWDKDGTAYPIDMEVIHLNDENGGIDYGNTAIRDAIKKIADNETPILNRIQKEVLAPDRSISIAAIRSGHSLRAEYEVDELIRPFEEILHAHPEIDLIAAPEYYFFNNPNVKTPLKFAYSGNEYLLVSGDPELIEGMNKLTKLAKDTRTSICVGTVCEAEDIEDVQVFHNTAIIIDSDGKIVQLRRKFTGSDSIRFTDDNYDTNDFFWHDENDKYRDGIFIPDRNFNPSSKEERIMVKAMWSAQDSIKPLRLKSKNGEAYSVLVGICAEMHDERFSMQATDTKTDVLLSVALEGDAHYTEHSELQLFGEIDAGSLTNKILKYQTDGLPAWEDPLARSREWAENYIRGKDKIISRDLNYAKAHNTVSEKGLWVAVDGYEDQAGVFPVSRRESVKTANFTKDYLIVNAVV